MAFKSAAESFRKQMFLNFKGGTGKTTLAAAYGLQLAETGRRVLFVDLDPQGHLTKCLGVNEWQFGRTLYHVLVREARIAEVMKKLAGLEAHVVPADISLSATDLSLNGLPYREWRLVHALAPLRRQFDVVLFDASPTISLLNLNAILASRDLIVPVLPDSLSLHGLKTLLATLTSIETDFDHRIENVGILLNRFLPDDAHCVDFHKRLKKIYKGHVLRTVIRYCPDLGNQPSLDRVGARLRLEGQVLEDIRDLMKEIAPTKKRKAGERKSEGA